MGWKVVHLTKPCKIKIRSENLLLHFYESDEEVKVTLRDIDFLLFDNSQFSITGKALELLAKNNIATLFIDDTFHPSSILTPYHSHSLMSETAHLQISISQEFKNQVWQKIVQSKIYNQAKVLEFFGNDASIELQNLASDVQAYDKNGDEAQAARLYWKKLFDMKTFRRDQEGLDIINAMLNYSYAIIRASMARSVSASGLLPVFGLWHQSRYNAFNLVDDLMEVFRPFCDLHVKLLLYTKHKHANNLTVGIKRELVALLVAECVLINGGKSSVSNAIELFVRQYKKAMSTNSTTMLFYPEIDREYFRDELF
jgi:CRISPR-associated protein Cas1